ncbi:zinc dependent phospholipase C family protein [Desulforamulus putei]|uniref:Phospholipase C n=1 Tax=Desulforamulus putei DSM 12395 TaxID=1121429 RepID=A0A1M4TV03_9FIRM|nr:zinc dependent phospholipase C family protein [Desulforamulus putei]SHE48224.1 phospholipase C [Desulforamulus putei DSM 12395]
MTLTQATWNCAKVMLALTSPLQVMIKTRRPRNTHHFCNRQAVQILRRDGLQSEALFFQSYLDVLNHGSSWSDRGFKNISHYYNYRENTGLWHGPDAPTECRYYFNRAIKHWRRGRREKAIFYLGAAGHILQDLCVPHHAGGLVFSGHKYFEDWARDHYEDFATSLGGLYDLGGCAGDWVKQNAMVAAGYLPEVMEDNAPAVEKVCGLLLQRAQRTTAGFLHFFIQRVKPN